MSGACTPGLVGVTSSVSEIWLPFKNSNFPFLTMDYSPWSWRNLIDRNWLKNFMQVGVDVECTHTNFGGCGLFGFGDKISLLSIIVEKFNQLESAQKFLAGKG